jgi:hypothetical protein
MRDIFRLFLHVIVTVFRLGQPGGFRSIIEMKQRNPTWECPRIAEQINLAFGTSIDKDVVRRILAQHSRSPIAGGPSWLTFLGHIKDSLWIIDLIRCESVALRTYWVLVVMDHELMWRLSPAAIPLHSELFAISAYRNVPVRA